MPAPLRVPAIALIAISLSAWTNGVASGQTSDPAGVLTAQASQARPLSGLYQALRDLQAGKRERVRILQIGDSHTAGDIFSGRLRELFQERFGNGGRGMMPPGYPFPYWRPAQVEVAQHGRWDVQSSNRTDYRPLPFGVSGFITESRAAGDTMSLEANTDAEFDSIDIDYIRQPNGGRLDVSVDGRRVEQIDTRGPAGEWGRKTISTRAARTLELRTTGNGVTSIADWAVYKKTRGVVLDSFGFSGAEIGIVDHWSSPQLDRQLRDLSPALIVLAFGTNEGFRPSLNPAEYESQFRRILKQLHDAAPAASLLVVGPPDANRLPDYCGIRPNQKEAVPCGPLSASEARDYSGMLAHRDRQLCRWHTPAGIALVRDVQRRAAADMGALFWDWSEVQGGACGANRWVPQQLEHPDRIHMKEAGYSLSAERLFSVLMSGYGR